MKRTLWDTYYEANWSASCIAWRVYDANNNNKLICEDYTSLDGDDNSLDDMEVVSKKLVIRPNGSRFVKAYVR